MPSTGDIVTVSIASDHANLRHAYPLTVANVTEDGSIAFTNGWTLKPSCFPLVASGAMTDDHNNTVWHYVETPHHVFQATIN